MKYPIQHAYHCPARKPDGVHCTCGLRTNQEKTK